MQANLKYKVLGALGFLVVTSSQCSAMFALPLEFRSFESEVTQEREAQPKLSWHSFAFAGDSTNSEETEQLPAPLSYALVESDFEANAARPLLVALPPGSQDRSMVERGLELYWQAEAARRGWQVVSPVLASANLSEQQMSSFCEHLVKTYAPQSGGVYLAGVSAGGRSAFPMGLAFGKHLLGLVVAPGYATAEYAPRLSELAHVPAALYVGGDDSGWLQRMQPLRDDLLALGAPRVTFQSFAGEGHVPPSLNGRLLFEELEVQRLWNLRRSQQMEAVRSVLDDFHVAASEADGERYFAHFAAGAVFLGTDASERWSIAEFQAYAEPYFSQGKGWTYVASERHVQLSPAGDVAWFDERLQNEKYGEVRGSGVLRLIGNHWRICQYNMAFPVPNELTRDLVERIRGLTK